MEIGISTASLFQRYFTEDAIKILSDNKVKIAEVFLESYCEYNKEFAKIINANKGQTKIHSVHTLPTQFEPQLFSANKRAQDDSFKMLENVLTCAKELNAKYYTLHGIARIKRTPMTINYDAVAVDTQRVIDLCKRYNITLAQENVHWCAYNYIGYFSEIKKRTNGLKGTLDIKQARQSGLDYRDLINEMKEDIVTVHVSDIDQNGKMVLPTKGITDFNELFKRLYDVGFNGAILLEVYKNDFNDLSELFESVNALGEIADRIYK